MGHDSLLLPPSPFGFPRCAIDHPELPQRETGQDGSRLLCKRPAEASAHGAVKA